VRLLFGNFGNFGSKLRAPHGARPSVRLCVGLIKPVKFTLLRCTSAELVFSCCDSVAAPRATARVPRSSTCDARRVAPRVTALAPRSSTCDAQRAAPRATALVLRPSTCDSQRGNGLVTRTKYLRRTTSGAAGNGLGTTIKYRQRKTSGAISNDLGTSIKYLRRTASSAADNGLGTTIKYLRSSTNGRGQIPKPAPEIADVSLRHKRPAFALFWACLLRQQAEEHFRGPGFRCPVWRGSELARCVHTPHLQRK
jgi:hypothetical protein